MDKTIEKLWEEDWEVKFECRKLGVEEKKLIDSTVEMRDKFSETLNSEQKALFEEIEQDYCYLKSISEKELFAFGFKLGANLMKDMLS